MEALVPAFLAAALTQLGDRAPLLTAILADRYGRPLLVALAAMLAHAAGNAIAALGGFWLAPLLTPEAQALLLALALLFGGVALLWGVARPDHLDRWRLGAFLTPFLGVFILAFGDSAQFFTLAIAARSSPWFAAVGAALGAGAVAFVAAVLGEQGWRGLRFRPIRIVVATGFLIGALVVALGAMRLV